MKTILVSTDFSNNAYCALFYAAKLFEDEPSRFIILNSFENQISYLSNPVGLGGTEEMIDRLHRSSEAASLAVQHKLKNDLETTKHTFEIIATSLALVKAINKLISKENVDLVVMGSRGKTQSNGFFFGSNSFEVLKNIKKAPLLIVPKELDFSTPKKIGFATGFKYRYELPQLDLLLNLTKRFLSNVKVLYISENKKLSKEQKANFHHLFTLSGDCKFEFNWLQETESKYKTLMDYMDKEQLDMLVLSYYKHSFISNLFREKMVKDIAFNSSIPLLVLPGSD